MFDPEYQPTSFQALIELIHRNNSRTVIEYMIEEYQVLFEDREQQRLLQHLQSLRDLDEIRLSCAAYLGLHEEVATLRQWIEQKKSSPSPASLLH